MAACFLWIKQVSPALSPTPDKIYQLWQTRNVAEMCSESTHDFRISRVSFCDLAFIILNGPIPPHARFVQIHRSYFVNFL